MGALLGKSLGEIRSLPFPEFLKWQIFSLVEPFGFPDREYRTAAVLTQLHNQSVTRRSQRKKVSAVMRDMFAGVLRQIRSAQVREERSVGIDLQTEDGKKFATQEVIRVFESIFGPLRRKSK